MKNILSYIQYKEKVRLYESMMYQEDTNVINEGIIDTIKEKISTKYVDKVLADEIELGKQVEERIKSTMKELEEVSKKINIKNDSGSEFKKSLDKIIDEINKTSFDTLSLLGDTNVDFGGFKKSAVMANVINLSVLLSPIKNALMVRRAYKYFIGLIKQTLRKDLVMLLVNFDQFQNMILQKSLESEDNARVSREVNQAYGKIEGLYQQALAEAVGKKSNKFMDKIKKAMEIKKQEMDIMDRHNPMAQFFMNSYDNTYKQSADSLKQLIGEDSQKNLDAYKNSIQKIGSTDKDGKLGIYGEFLISAAEEKAMKTTVAIHTNFLKISEVFKLSNQKKLVEMMQKAEEEYQNEIAEKERERKDKESKEFNKKISDWVNKEGKHILKSVKSFDDFDKLHGELEGPDDFKLSKKEIVVRYLQNEKTIPDYLKVVVPFGKYDSNYDKCYLSYLDILVEKVWKMFGESGGKIKDYYIDYEEMNDDSGVKRIQHKFFKSGTSDISDNTKNALKYISDTIVKFDYNLLMDKMEKMEDEKINKRSTTVTLKDKSYKELHDAIEYMKKYIDNDYTKPEDGKKSED